VPPEPGIVTVEPAFQRPIKRRLVAVIGH
jgi:hypothetical protein